MAANTFPPIVEIISLNFFTYIKWICCTFVIVSWPWFKGISCHKMLFGIYIIIPCNCFLHFIPQNLLIQLITNWRLKNIWNLSCSIFTYLFKPQYLSFPFPYEFLVCSYFSHNLVLVFVAVEQKGLTHNFTK